MTSTKSAELKAYAVQNDEHGCIVFESNSALARRGGANVLGCDWEDIESCRRAQWADPYATQRRVPPLIMMEHGWWFECGHCGVQVSSDSCGHDDDGNEIPHTPVVDGDIVYCTQLCMDKEKLEQEIIQAHADAATQAVTNAYPGVHVLWVGTRHGTDGTAVSFTFPGGQRAVDWVVGEETVLVCKCDVEAWKKFKNSADEVAA